MDRRLATQPQDLGPGTETSCAALRTARSWGPRGQILATVFAARPPPKNQKKAPRAPCGPIPQCKMLYWFVRPLAPPIAPHRGARLGWVWVWYGGPNWPPGPLGSVAGDGPDRHRGWLWLLVCPSSVPAAGGRGLRPRMSSAHRP
jgi:hypothetical protein